MKYCDSAECSGLDPCKACIDVRQKIWMRAVIEAGLSKEQADKFSRAYGEAFDAVLSGIRKVSEELMRKRLLEKEARDRDNKQAQASKEKEGREGPSGPGVRKVGTTKMSPTTKKVAEAAKASASAKSDSPAALVANGQQENKAAGTTLTANKNEQQHHTKD